jgi:hypothetical protein
VLQPLPPIVAPMIDEVPKGNSAGTTNVAAAQLERESSTR